MNSPLPSEDKWGTWVLAVLQLTSLLLYDGMLGTQFTIDGSQRPAQGIVLDKDGPGTDVIMNDVTAYTVGNWWSLCTEITLFYSPQIFHFVTYWYSPFTQRKAWHKEPNSVRLVLFKTLATQKTVRYVISQHHRKKSHIFYHYGYKKLHGKREPGLFGITFNHR